MASGSVAKEFLLKTYDIEFSGTATKGNPLSDTMTNKGIEGYDIVALRPELMTANAELNFMAEVFSGHQIITHCYVRANSSIQNPKCKMYVLYKKK